MKMKYQKRKVRKTPAPQSEYSSKDKNISIEELKTLLSGASDEIASFMTK